MKSDKKILIAFILNLFFSIFEFIGGTLTNSVAIISDSIHDIGDSLSIGISYVLEKKSRKKPDNTHTYGYIRYSVIGSIITTTILIIGSILIIYNALKRIITPVNINYHGMLIFSIIGTVVNFLAAYFTKEGHSLNQKSVNLHMIEDVLGWLVVLIGAIIMKLTEIKIIDPILSIIVALFIFINAVKNLKDIINIFLEKTPSNIDIDHLREKLLKIKGVENVHHIHIWSIDGYNNYATLHVVTKENNPKIKHLVKDEFKKHGISHTTIEIEEPGEKCEEENCNPLYNHHGQKNHHH